MTDMPAPPMTDTTPRAAEQAVEEIAEPTIADMNDAFSMIAAMERVDQGSHVKLISLLDGNETWEGRAGDRRQEFAFRDDASEWVADLRREDRARALARAVRHRLVPSAPDRDAALARALPSAVGVPVAPTPDVREVYRLRTLMLNAHRKMVRFGWTFDGTNDALVTMTRLEEEHEDRWRDFARYLGIPLQEVDSALASGAQAGAAGDRPGAAPAGGLPGVEAIAEVEAARARGGPLRTLADMRRDFGDARPEMSRSDLLAALADAENRLSAAGAGDAGRDDLREEVAYWRRDAAARLWNARTLLKTHRRYGDDDKAMLRRDELRTTIAAVQEADAKAWSEGDEITNDLQGQIASARAALEADDATWTGETQVSPPEAPARSTAADGLRSEAIFLLERLEELGDDAFTEDGHRDFHGHVVPSMSRLLKIVTALDDAPSADRGEAGFPEPTAVPSMFSAVASIPDPNGCQHTWQGSASVAGPGGISTYDMTCTRCFARAKWPPDPSPTPPTPRQEQTP